MVTRKRALEVLAYAPKSGSLVWKVTLNSRAPAGSEAGTLRADGYRQVRLDGEKLLAHRLIFLMQTGKIPVEVDHKNRVRNDNRWKNLRAATSSENSHNTKIRATNTSGCKGVSWDKSIGKWVARIYVEKQLFYLGSFLDKSKAIRARQRANKQFNVIVV
jgi:hypothetical protein